MQSALDWMASENGQEPEETHDSDMQDAEETLGAAEERERQLNRRDREFLRRRSQLANQWMRDIKEKKKIVPRGNGQGP